MRTLAKLIALLVFCSSSALAADRVGDFALLDSQGDFHKISYYDNHTAIALLVQRNDSKATDEAIGAFEDAQTKHHGRVKFFMLNPIVGATRAAVQETIKRYDTDIRVLMDDAQVISKAMGVDKVGEVFLLDSRSFTVLYRGPVGEPFDRAIDETLAGKVVSRPVVRVKGEKIAYAKQLIGKPAVSYSKDIAPILVENCARCHREGGIGPFAMNSHAVVRGFAPMIREVVLTKRMPPGQIDPYVGHFKTTYTLTPLQTQKLVQWIEAGAKQDGKVDPLAELRWPKSKWTLGEPDLVVKIPAQTIPATGVLPLVDVTVPIDGLDRDRYVRASEYLPGDRKVLHHTVTTVVPPPSSGDLAYGIDTARLVAYIPGTPPLVEPPSTGGILRKGSTLALNLHYTTMGKATTDAGEIGIWFYPDDEPPTERMTVECGCILGVGWKPIPPNAPHHEMKRTITLPKDATLYSLSPHMHFRGKSMRFHVDYPDGRREVLLNVANYQYNWQMTYDLIEPKQLPAGTKLVVSAAFDNSVQNKANPDPSRRVPFGEQSWDEMMFSVISLKYSETGAAAQSQK